MYNKTSNIHHPVYCPDEKRTPQIHIFHIFQVHLCFPKELVDVLADVNSRGRQRREWRWVKISEGTTDFSSIKMYEIFIGGMNFSLPKNVSHFCASPDVIHIP
jgi:hypothetical protein